jgi:hypothetical protein
MYTRVTTWTLARNINLLKQIDSMMKQISIYFKSGMYLQTEQLNPKPMPMLNNLLQFIITTRIFIFLICENTFICTLWVTLTELEGTISISNFGDDEDDTSLPRLEIYGAPWNTQNVRTSRCYTLPNISHRCGMQFWQLLCSVVWLDKQQKLYFNSAILWESTTFSGKRTK